MWNTSGEWGMNTELELFLSHPTSIFAHSREIVSWQGLLRIMILSKTCKHNYSCIRQHGFITMVCQHLHYTQVHNLAVNICSGKNHLCHALNLHTQCCFLLWLRDERDLVTIQTCLSEWVHIILKSLGLFMQIENWPKPFFLQQWPS